MPQNPPHSRGLDANARPSVRCSDVLDTLFEATINETSFEHALGLLTQLLLSPRAVLGYIDEFGDLMVLLELAADQRPVPTARHALGFATEDWCGAWGTALRSAEVRVSNEPLTLGPSCFHCQRELAAAIRFDGGVIGLIYVADKLDDYSQQDAALIDTFARRVAAPLGYQLTQRRFRRELEAAEQMASAAAEGERFFMLSPDPMIIMDSAIRRANASFTAMSGYTDQELRGMSLAELVRSEDRPRFESELHRIRTEPNREHSAVAVELLTKAGEQRRVEWVGAATEDGRVYAVGRDITVLSQAMEELEMSNTELHRLNSEARAEEQVAARLLAHVRKQGCLDSPGIQYVASPLGFFNGDAMLATVTPAGHLCWMLGDFTGHGLSAAIGTVPLAGAFHMACRNGLTFQRMISQINDMLKGLLPTGLFCAAAFLSLNPTNDELWLWNCGLPPVLLRRGNDASIQHFDSQSLPLGLVASADLDISPTLITVQQGDDVFVFSDGLTESADDAGRQFGVDGVRMAVDSARRTGEGFTAIMHAVSRFRGGNHVKDDLSLICVSVGHTGPNARSLRTRETQDSTYSTDSSPRSMKG